MAAQDAHGRRTSAVSGPLGDDEVEARARLAREVCLRQLAGAPRSRADLSAALARKGFSREVVELTLDRLTALGLVDDRAFADWFVTSARRNQGLAGAALAQRLHGRGVDQSIIALAVGGRPDDERAAAEALVRRRIRTVRGLDDAAGRRRLVGYLLRRGYTTSTALAAVTSALARSSGSGTSIGAGARGAGSGGSDLDRAGPDGADPDYADPDYADLD